MLYDLPDGTEIETKDVTGIELYSIRTHYPSNLHLGHEPRIGPITGRVTVIRRIHGPVELEFDDLEGAKAWATVFGEQCNQADPANLDDATLKAALLALPAGAAKPAAGTLLDDALIRFTTDAEPLHVEHH